MINKDGMVTAGAYERTMTAKEKDNVSSHSLRSFVSSRGSLRSHLSSTSLSPFMAL